MIVKKLAANDSDFPVRLRTIPTPPKTIYYTGSSPASWQQKKSIAIVGSRAITPYGRVVTGQLARELAEQGIVLVSGLAIGVDCIAQSAAVEAGGIVVAVLPTSLDNIYPASNRQLANRIIETGGTLITEYAAATPGFKANFIARNRLVSGLADALLITEAAEKSGTMHTARFALEQGRDVLVVPGNITSPTSSGCNNLIKAGAQPITCVQDVLNALNIESAGKQTYKHRGASVQEQAILDLMYQGKTDGFELLERTGLSVDTYNLALTMLELNGKIQALGNNHWAPR